MKRLITGLLNLMGVYRIVFTCYQRLRYVFDSRLRKKNRKWIKQGAPDGLPIPPPRLVNLVSGHFDMHVFYQNGRLGADCIRAILEKNGIELNGLFSFLDFGCGCGRILRFWNELQGPRICGSDYNRDLVAWCRNHLPFGHFQTNKPQPPLDYHDEEFEFVYAISVFTHLAEKWQTPWMKELWRICRPGGFVLFTVHGESYLDRLPDDEKEKFRAGKLAVIRERYTGSNICGVFHPESFVRNVLAAGFSVIDFWPLGAKDANQDMYLFKKSPLP
jgi:SAM-dependent methyltransferase